MLSDIFGEDKREKYLIILNLLKDRDVTGIVYGREGIGKRFIINKAIRSVASDKDRVIYIESSPEWYLQLLSRLGIPVKDSLSREEFLLHMVEFLEKFPGRLFVVFTDGQEFNEKQLAEVIHLLGFKDRVSTIVIGDEKLKELINPFKIGKLEKALNFIFEIRPPEPEEYVRYFEEKYTGKVSKGAAKKLHTLTGGSIGKGEEIILKLGKFPVNERDIPGGRKSSKTVLVFAVVILILAGGIFYFTVIRENPWEKNSGISPASVVLEDKKLPEEGKVINELPIKPRKKTGFTVKNTVGYINQKIENSLKNTDFNIPPLKHYVPPERYLIQVASFKNRKNALRLKEKLLENFTAVKILQRKNGINTVVILSHTREETDKIVKKLSGMGFKPLVRKVKKDG